MSRRQPLSATYDAEVLAAPLPQQLSNGHSRYRDFQPLARGGKAEVFLCIDSLLGRQVVYKVLHPRLMHSPVEQQMLAREARTMAAMQHPCIPEVYNLGRDPAGRPFFTMAFQPGYTLHEVLNGIRRSGAVREDYPLVRLLGMLLEAGRVLAYAHEMNVVHCDLKPENLILRPASGVAVVDWGLAVVDDRCNAQGPNPAVLQRGCQGSALYMSPEQARGEPRFGPPADVYGLGVLLYECLTLETPCRGATSSETLRNVVHEPPTPPHQLGPSRLIPERLEQLCLRARAKSPHDRFATATEFCDALQDCWIEMLAECSPEGHWEREAGETGPGRTHASALAEQERTTRRYCAAIA